MLADAAYASPPAACAFRHAGFFSTPISADAADACRPYLPLLGLLDAA